MLQLQLYELWPLDILECDDGREVYDVEGNLIVHGLSVHMEFHCGTPVCEPDPITNWIHGYLCRSNQRACSRWTDHVQCGHHPRDQRPYWTCDGVLGIPTNSSHPRQNPHLSALA